MEYHLSELLAIKREYCNLYEFYTFAPVFHAALVWWNYYQVNWFIILYDSDVIEHALVFTGFSYIRFTNLLS